MGKGCAETRQALLAPFVALGLAFIHPAPVHAERAARPSDGEWVQSFYYASGGFFSSSVTPVIVPPYDLVVAFSTEGAEATSLSDADRHPTIDPAGAPPGSPVLASVFDPLRDRVLVFRQQGHDFEEMATWALILGDTLRWERLETTGSPIWSPSASALYDTRRDRIILFGGTRAEEAGLWSLSMHDLHWTKLRPAGAGPESRLSHSATYDPVLDRMIIFGGQRRWAEDGLSDTWALSFGGLMRWHRLDPSGDEPQARLGHSAIYDPKDRRIVVFGGLATLYPVSLLADAWELSLAGRPRWKELSARGEAPSIAFHGAAYDASQDRMVVGKTNGIWSLRWERRGRPFDAPLIADQLPSSEAGSPETPTSGELRVYDLQGRLVLTRGTADAESWLARHRFGAAGPAAGMGTGVYFAQIRDRFGSVTWHRTVVLGH